MTIQKDHFTLFFYDDLSVKKGFADHSGSRRCASGHPVESATKIFKTLRSSDYGLALKALLSRFIPPVVDFFQSEYLCVFFFLFIILQ